MQCAILPYTISMYSILTLKDIIIITVYIILEKGFGVQSMLV